LDLTSDTEESADEEGVTPTGVCPNGTDITESVPASKADGFSAQWSDFFNKYYFNRELNNYPTTCTKPAGTSTVSKGARGSSISGFTLTSTWTFENAHVVTFRVN